MRTIALETGVTLVWVMFAAKAWQQRGPGMDITRADATATTKVFLIVISMSILLAGLRYRE